MSLVWMIVLAVVLLLGAAVVNVSETSLGALSRARVQEMAREEQAGAKLLLKIFDSRARYINSLILLRTVMEISATVTVVAIFTRVLQSDGWAFAATIMLMSLVSYLVLGVFSRSIGRRDPYKVGLATAGPVVAVSFLLRPFEKLLIGVGNLFVPGGGYRDGPFSTEVELREIVDMAQERGIVQAEEQRMIKSVIDLASTTARSVMVPRPDIVWIEEDKNIEQAIILCERSGHSRIPVIGEDADDIVGVVYLKDLVPRNLSASDPLAGHMRTPLFIPDSKPLDELLNEMQRTRIHIAVLIDEYGGVAGLISIEDILEEIVGEIADEYDQDEISPVEELGEGTFRVVGKLSLDDLMELYEERTGEELRFDDDVLEEVDTVRGLLAYGLGRVPLPGSETELAGLKFTGEGGEDRRGRVRVDTVVISPGAPAEDESDSPDGDMDGDKKDKRDKDKKDRDKKDRDKKDRDREEQR